LGGLMQVPGKTFRWKGRYGYDLNEAHTLETHLNVFERFRPTIPPAWRKADYLFLANIHPELQMEVLKNVDSPSLVACDTMNFWIEKERPALLRLLPKVDILIINEAETRQLGEEANLIKAARKVLALGPKTLVVKRGEYGVLMFHEHSVFAAPAYPLEEVYDPTGAGDTFAGGFMGYLASTHNRTEAGIRQAIIFGSIMASFAVEDFSLERMKRLDYREIEARFRKFRLLTEFSGLD
ncbi:MAG: bifunctional hydroxymethylpyrimidine kinase/phosphomethylpyrimidine kinase, partial [Deltaproteobacteria bacterium]|nr:bifunctional hydroxymethylpyrimidine kinase/phosphomethylpyrimidine kinase [Deltaproteobacteria bacterium]